MGSGSGGAGRKIRFPNTSGGGNLGLSVQEIDLKKAREKKAGK